MNDFPGELVILDIGADAGFDVGDCNRRQCGQALAQSDWIDIANQILQNLNRQCSRSDTTTALSERKMDEFIGTGTNGAGCVLPGKYSLSL
jgi:hypothetical protein